MSSLRQVGLGILAALFSTAIVFGSLLLALVEGGMSVAMLPAITEPPQVVSPEPGEPTFTSPPKLFPSPMPTSACALTPSDWVEYTIYPGDTLPAIAALYGISVEMLRDNNCLSSDQVVAGSLLAVPPELPQLTPTPTQTPVPPTATRKKPKATQNAISSCSGHPRGWIAYKVRRGDNLFRIAYSYGLSTAELASANCLGRTSLRVGQIIYVPSYPSKTPKLSATSRSTPQPPPVETTVPPETTEPPEITEPPTTTEPPVITEPPQDTEPVVPPTEEPPPPPPETTEPPPAPPSPDPSEPYPQPQS